MQLDAGPYTCVAADFASRDTHAQPPHLSCHRRPGTLSEILRTCRCTSVQLPVFADCFRLLTPIGFGNCQEHHKLRIVIVLTKCAAAELTACLLFLQQQEISAVSRSQAPQTYCRFSLFHICTHLRNNSCRTILAKRVQARKSSPLRSDLSCETLHLACRAWLEPAGGRRNVARSTKQI